MTIAQKKPRDQCFDLIDEEVIDSALVAYDLRGYRGSRTIIVDGERLKLLSERSETSRKVIIDCGTYGLSFLKQIPWYCDTSDTVRFHHRLTRYLITAGIPVPRIKRTQDDRTWLEAHGGRFVLMEYIDGVPFDGSVGHCATAAHTLSALHRHGESFSIVDSDPRTSLAAIVLSHVMLARKLKSCSIEILDEIESFAHRWFSIEEPLSVIPVHGDFIPWNLAFGKDSVTAVYDLDNAAIDTRLHDLGEAIVAFFGLRYVGQSSRLVPQGIQNPDARAVAAFIRTYDAALPLWPKEWRALPFYVLGAWWECLLLSFIRGEQPWSYAPCIADLPKTVEGLWEKAGFSPQPDWSKS